MNNDIEKSMVILHMENYVVCQKEEQLYDGFILCNFDLDDDAVIINELYEDFNEGDVLMPQYTNVEMKLNKPTAIMSSSTLVIDGVFKEEDTTINETHETPLEVLCETETNFQEEPQYDDTEPEVMTSSTSSLDSEEEHELENQLIYYNKSIKQFDDDIQLYEKMLSGLIYKNINLYKYKFGVVNNTATYNSISRKIQHLKTSKKNYEKTLEDILKLQRNDKNTILAK